MRKISVFVGLFILSITLSTSNLYAVCTLTGGKVEVSKAGGQACGSINTAANLADNIIVSVLPGTYLEQVVITKSNVKIVGSGQENTKIASSAYATVTGGPNSSIENIWIDNSGATERNSTAVRNVSIINNVKITVSASQPMTSGIDISSTPDAIVSNSNIAVSGSVDILGILAGNNTTIRNCIINATAVPSGVTNSWTADVYSGIVKIEDSVLTSQGAQYNYVIYGGTGFGASLMARNVEMTSIAGAPGENYILRGTNVVTGSKLFLGGDLTHACISVGGVASIGGSQISGFSSQSGGCGTLKIVNSWDENFSQIPNQ